METQPARKPYRTDVSDEEWAFLAPYLTLMAPDAPQRRHDLRAILRWGEGRADDPKVAVLDSRTVQSSPESGARAGYDGHERRKGSKAHVAVDTLGHLLALRVTPAGAQDRDQVAAVAAAVQAATGENVEVALSTGATPARRPRPTPRPTASGWRPSSRRRPSAASSRCLGGGWRRAPSPGRRASAAWRGTTNGCPKRLPARIPSPSPA